MPHSRLTQRAVPRRASSVVELKPRRLGLPNCCRDPRAIIEVRSHELTQLLESCLVAVGCEHSCLRIQLHPFRQCRCAVLDHTLPKVAVGLMTRSADGLICGELTAVERQAERPVDVVNIDGVRHKRMISDGSTGRPLKPRDSTPDHQRAPITGHAAIREVDHAEGQTLPNWLHRRRCG